MIQEAQNLQALQALEMVRIGLAMGIEQWGTMDNGDVFLLTYFLIGVPYVPTEWVGQSSVSKTP